MNFFLIFLSVALNCGAQVLMRKAMLVIGEVGSQPAAHTAMLMVSNAFLWLALICYGVSVLVWMAVLSKVEVSYAFPLGSIGYVIVAVLGYLFLGEQVTPLRLFGILIICLGVFVVSRS